MALKHILIIDAFPLEDQALVRKALGLHGFGRLIEAELGERWRERICIEVINGLEVSPQGSLFDSADGVIWTGSPLSVTDESIEVRQLEQWMALCTEHAMPVFAICFGMQLAAKLAGGRVERNAWGLETLLARKISLTAAGSAHAMMAGRDGCYDAIADHVDHVVELPSGATCLAGNRVTSIQAAVIPLGKTEVWGVQYHPDMDIYAIRALLDHRREDLLRERFFADDKEFESYYHAVVRFLEAEDRERAAWKLGYDSDILEADKRLTELENWLRFYSIC